METFETIAGVFLVACLLLLALGVLFMIGWSVIVGSYCDHVLDKPTNKIQWRCEESYDNKNKFKNGEIDKHVCELSYRVLPSELSKFVRIFGTNAWDTVFYELKFANGSEFRDFVYEFKTVGDIKRYIDKENGILWYEPPME